MSDDQMQDVYPIQFNFKSSEQPTGEKLSALVKHTDSAFSNITQAIGDPWDYQSHSIGLLSLARLGQSSLARMAGPSDWLSPIGGCWNEQLPSTVDVTLVPDKNSWVLGYPLVKVTTPIEEATLISSAITPLTWDTAPNDIVVVASTDPAGVLTTEVASADLVVSTGLFYVDYYRGTIVSYDTPADAITIRISNLHMFGPGVPWGTHNIIPTWTDTVGLCTASPGVDIGGGQMRYTLSLPTVSKSPRVGTEVIRTGKRSYSSGDYDASWNIDGPNHTTSYRLPASLTTAGLAAGTTIPGGYLLLWDDTAGRVIPLVTFKYRDENSLTLETTTNWLTAGSRYRIITSGSSISESISYLLQTTRNAASLGLSNTSSISYSIPISHDNLEHRYNGNLDSGFSDLSKTEATADWFKFRESSYPTNPHPQYLHRYGYMASDASGNDSNALRGDLLLLSNSLADNVYSNSYKVAFGRVADNYLGYEGTYNETPGSGSAYVAANRYGFYFDSIGACPDAALWGAMTFNIYDGSPLYIRGKTDTSPTWASSAYRGAVIAMDLAQSSEMNYIKLMPAHRSGSFDVSNMPAATPGQVSPTTTLDITPSIVSASGQKRLSASQIREFRFRGVSNVPTATNTSLDSLYSAEGHVEFKYYFTSPGMAGVDFLNIYSNAIFFSDTGDGKLTSFTTNGNTWMNSNSDSDRPSGMYYVPDISAAPYTPYFKFCNYETGYGGKIPLQFGYTYGLNCNVVGNIDIDTQGDFDLEAVGTVYVSSGTNLPTASSSTTNKVYIAASKNTVAPTSCIQILTDNTTSLTGYSNYTAAQDILIGSGHYLGILADDYIGIGCDGDIAIVPQDDFLLLAGLTANRPTYSLPGRVGQIIIGADDTTGSIQLLTKNTVGTIVNKDIFIHSGNNIEINSTGATEITSIGNIALITTGRVNITAAGGTASTPDNSNRVYFLTGSYDIGNEYGLSIDNNGRLHKDSSSVRYKENIKDLNDSSWILDLKIREFNFKTGDMSKTRYGLIAEEAILVNSLIVGVNENNEPDFIYNNEVFYALVKLVQDQQKEIDELKNQIENLNPRY